MKDFIINFMKNKTTSDIFCIIMYVLCILIITNIFKIVNNSIKCKKYKYTKEIVDKIIKCIPSVVKDPKSIKRAKKELKKFLVSEKGKHLNEMFEKSNKFIIKGDHVNIHGITINDDPRTMVKFVTNIFDRLDYWDTYDLTINKEGELERIELSDYTLQTGSEIILKQKPLYELLYNFYNYF